MKYIGLAFLKLVISFVLTSFVTVYHIAMSMAVLNTFKFPQFIRINRTFCQFSNRPTSLLTMFSI